MTDAGFWASSSGGSAVTVTHKNGGQIIFHRPHPIATLDQSMLVWIGKHIKKSLGIDMDIFVCTANAEKEKKEVSLAGEG